ncbi:GNAT family N-acetyltransferase [Aquimarina algicola]|uniref:GNAT family N-acetyltransferase n=1 Tax=Aquimarina algicola TaxID=2589995 RepID=A0A504JD72_9FLAO|nr:GNAT family N-acetyltransferase [Aquimarina algicola]TPN84530.1 GNAT family N-acetyltransferase [Aquimarina algicola]
MISGTQNDRKRIIDIIANSFDSNKSTNYTIKQDKKRQERLRFLVEYSVFQGEKFGEILMSRDKNAACIIIFPWFKSFSLLSLIWDIKLIFKAVGLRNLNAVLKRERLLKKNHPATPFYHLWYIGVDPDHQNKGTGSKLLEEVLENFSDKPIYLETSVTENLRWYHKYGFEIIDVLDLGYKLYILRKQ